MARLTEMLLLQLTNVEVEASVNLHLIIRRGIISIFQLEQNRHEVVINYYGNRFIQKMKSKNFIVARIYSLTSG